MPPDTTKQEFQVMLRNLLAERFHLVVHHDIRYFPGYNLVVSKDGPKLKTAAISGIAADEVARTPLTGLPKNKDGAATLPPGPLAIFSLNKEPKRVVYQEQPIARLAADLGGLISSPAPMSMTDLVAGKAVVTGRRPRVSDKTGLTGVYDFTLEFSSASLSDDGINDSGSPQLGIFKAIEKQLGLKLEKTSDVPADLIVVDHVDKIPTEN